LFGLAHLHCLQVGQHHIGKQLREGINQVAHE
jgi:hypothetical protein